MWARGLPTTYFTFIVNINSALSQNGSNFYTQIFNLLVSKKEPSKQSDYPLHTESNPKLTTIHSKYMVQLILRCPRVVPYTPSPHNNRVTEDVLKLVHRVPAVGY